ncbi:MAG: SlyX family protein [bacterium]
MRDSEEQVGRLQVLIMEHEKLLEQYSDLIHDQQRQIDQLITRIERLELKLSKYEHNDTVSQQDERPPHY